MDKRTVGNPVLLSTLKHREWSYSITWVYKKEVFAQMESSKAKDVNKTDLEQNQEQQQGRNKHRMIEIITFIILIIIIILLLLRSCGTDTSTPISDSSIEQGIINIESGEDIQKRVNDVVEQGMFQVFMNTKIHVNSENEADLLIQNAESNHYAAYVEICIDDESIYKSGIIQPGYKLERDTIQADLALGTYDCTAYFHVVDENNSEINSIGLQIKITKESKSK